MKTFLAAYFGTLYQARLADFSDNWDELYYGPEPVGSLESHNRFVRWLRRAGILDLNPLRHLLRGWRYIRRHLRDLQWLYVRLGDECSQSWLVDLILFRALGHRMIKLSTNTQEYWRVRNLALSIPAGKEEIDIGFSGWKLRERSLESFGYPIQMFTLPEAFYTTFALHQYRCKTPKGVIGCARGDIVIDAGGCYGDTALYFAHQAGPQGRVASFEFLPANVVVLRRNLALNSGLAQRIRLFENPVWSKSGEKLFVSGNGPGTKVSSACEDPGASRVETLKIDDWVACGDYPRIDFIKMDIEGAELEALRGSEMVLRRFRPKLAICVYHNLEDFWAIPGYLDGLGLGYRFYLRHFTIGHYESVLFADSSKSA